MIFYGEVKNILHATFFKVMFRNQNHIKRKVFVNVFAKWSFQGLMVEAFCELCERQTQRLSSALQ